MSTCSEDGCDTEAFTKGVCFKHYQREWRKRNAEKVKGYNDARRGTIAVRLCLVCGKDFEPTIASDRVIYCSKSCADYKLKRDARARGYKAPLTDARRNSAHRRRVRLRGGRTGREVVRDEILKRDAGRCGICGDPITADEWPHPLSLTLDHIIPIHRGGIHDPLNVQAAHSRCNSSKGARLPHELQVA